MTPNIVKKNVNCNTQDDVMCFTIRSKIMPIFFFFHLICFDLLNDWINVDS